jgi:hypothetical protein
MRRVRGEKPEREENVEAIAVRRGIRRSATSCISRSFSKPDTLTLGPFLCFDRLAPKVNHTTIYFNGGDPGVEMPHYHIVLWHVSKEGEQRIAQ